MVKWLSLCCFMIILIIMVGGATRLTNSGLSIVEWKPITGIIPPINDQDWQEEFSKYKKTPEYIQINKNMDIYSFKKIFWFEFIHRFLGRLVGIIYLLPLLYFYYKNSIKKQDIGAYIAILSIFFIQGFMGWYMVKSGLVSAPFVSHFRLGAHLIIATIIYNLLLWQFFKNKCDILIIQRDLDLSKHKSLAIISIWAIYIQIFLGALVSGLDAGLIYNDFPLMGNSFFPSEINFKNFDFSYFSNAAFVQFIHRIGAYIIAIIIVFMIINLYKIDHPKLKKAAIFTLFALLFQISLGIITIIYSVPIIIALLHQIGAIMLLSMTSWIYFLLKST